MYPERSALPQVELELGGQEDLGDQLDSLMDMLVEVAMGEILLVDMLIIERMNLSKIQS